jgi:molybdopterin synthase sulfur carrier subunit
MSVVRIPPTLRPEAGDRRQVEVAAGTVRDALAQLVEAYPALAPRLLGDDGLPPYLNLYVDGTDVRELDDLDTPLAEGSTLLLLPAMAGG